MGTQKNTVGTVRRFTLIGSVGNLLIAGLKFALGVIGSSQALVADAVHSVSDLVTDFAILVGVKYWSPPPENSHPYGHGRIEPIVTVSIGVAIAVVALGIGEKLRILGRVRLLLLAVALFAVEPAEAQQAERRGFVGLGIGPSIPVAGFADALPSRDQGGRTTTGYTSTLVNLGYRFRQRFGLAVAMSYSEYPVRGDDDDWWQVAGVTGGPMYSLPLSPRAALDLKAMFGMIVLTPVVDGYTTDHGVGVGLGFDFRATLRYDVFRRWALFVDGGLHSSNVSFDAVSRTDYRALVSGFGVAFRPEW